MKSATFEAIDAHCCKAPDHIYNGPVVVPFLQVCFFLLATLISIQCIAFVSITDSYRHKQSFSLRATTNKSSGFVRCPILIFDQLYDNCNGQLCLFNDLQMATELLLGRYVFKLDYINENTNYWTLCFGHLQMLRNSDLLLLPIVTMYKYIDERLRNQMSNQAMMSLLCC